MRALVYLAIKPVGVIDVLETSFKIVWRLTDALEDEKKALHYTEMAENL